MLQVELVKSPKDASGLLSVSNSPSTMLTVPINRRAVLTKLLIYNADSVAHTVLLGALSGTTFTQVLPALSVASGANLILAEDQVPYSYVESYSSATGVTINSWAAMTGESISTAPVQVYAEFEYE
jgi:hypothetical protein